MKLTIFALGSQGDVQPYLALGAGLQRAGHTVRVALPENFQAQATAVGLDTLPMHGNVQALMDQPELRALLARGDMLAINRYTSAAARAAAPLWAEQGLQAAQGADLLVTGLGTLAHSVGEKLGVPVLEAPVVPLTPTRDFPAVLLPPGTPWLGPWANRLTHRLVRQMMTRQGSPALTRRILGLPRTPRRSGHFLAAPTLYGISPSVLPRPSDWPQRVQLTGYWFLPEGAWAPPPGLEAFVQAGPPPVSIGFGSMGLRDPHQTTQLVLEALDCSQQRAVLLSGWGGLGDQTLPDHVFAAPPLPHSWLFPRVAAAVHHGGAGTTAASLRAGVPTLVAPFFGDQPFWGQRVQALGAGPAPLPQRTLSAAGLAAALRELAGNPGFTARAAQLGQQIRHEDGVGEATRQIEAYGTELGRG
ncbi:glycosyltransferase [Deinococcus sp. HMF7620]|uniref:Glycosyltransferase n=1 Tax=Deinococcus arboris TaxID=2682977 RepID=A0A7C9I938_9DEIO|nr:glycosyltransferase [Deinococcus arboris]MVN85966.1 glycosyltransferase [Deinococcus arboris]